MTLELETTFTTTTSYLEFPERLCVEGILPLYGRPRLWDVSGVVHVGWWARIEK